MLGLFCHNDHFVPSLVKSPEHVPLFDKLIPDIVSFSLILAWFIVVIKWLNKQINEQAMGRGARLSADLPSSIRPSPPAMYAGITTGLSTFHPSTQVS